MYIWKIVHKEGFTDHDYRIKALQWQNGDWFFDFKDILMIKGFELSHSWGHISILGDSGSRGWKNWIRLKRNIFPLNRRFERNVSI